MAEEQKKFKASQLWGTLMKGMARAEEVIKVLKMLKAIAWILTWMLSLPLEIILHRKFGERYLGVLPVTVSFLIGFGLTRFYSGDAELTANRFLTVSVVLAVVHLLLISIRISRGIRWHSFSNGISWLDILVFMPFSKNSYDAVITRFVEPFIVLIAALVIGVGGTEANSFGWYLAASGVALFIKAQVEYSRARHAFLNMIDNQIESENMQEAVAGSNRRKTEGFVVPGASSWSKSERAVVTDAMKTLDPALQAIITPAATQSVVDATGPAAGIKQ